MLSHKYSAVKLALVSVAVTIAGCSSFVLSSYVEPSGSEVAQITFRNLDKLPLGIHVYEDATDCRQKRRVIWIAPGTQRALAVKSSAATAYSLNTETVTENPKAGLPPSEPRTGRYFEYCLAAFSFKPEAGRRYEIEFNPTAEGCMLDTVELTPEGPKPLRLTRRNFQKPSFESGPFCTPLL